jgi:DNA invertase Pin-like site-specific DNA recombinase
MTKSTPTLAAIYVRQSRHKEGERTTSPEVQAEACKKLPAVKACASVEVFSDLDVSGKSKRGRKEFLRLIEKIRAGEVAVVAAYDQSRTFRSTRDALEFRALMAEPAYRKIDVQFVQGSFARDPVGKFNYTVIAAAHEMEREMVADKRAGTDARKAARGESRGMAPYGYRWHEGKFEVDKAEAVVVRRIFEDYAVGDTSAKALAAKLNADGVQRPGNRSLHGWLPDTVVDTLRRVAYVGKTYTEANRKGELIAAQWPAIINEPTFTRVQGLMEGRKVQARRPTPESYIFGRLLVCGRCGGIMRATRTYGHSYYHCRRDVSDPCTAPAVREDVLLSWAGALFLRIAERVTSGKLNITTKATKRKAAGPSPSGIEASLERLNRGWVRGETSEAFYESERPRLLAKLAEAKAAAVETDADLPKDNLYWMMALANWNHGADGETEQADPIMQRRTLNKLFEVLYVEDGAVVSYKPRAEQRAAIERVIGAVTKTAFTYDEPLTGRGSNLTKAARKSRRTARLPIHVDGISGKGGIRTLEGALHPLPA